MIKEAEEKDLNAYEDGAEKDAFKAALDEAKKVAGNEKVTQQEVDNAKTTLQTAMDALVEKAPVTPEAVDKSAGRYCKSRIGKGSSGIGEKSSG